MTTPPKPPATLHTIIIIIYGILIFWAPLSSQDDTWRDFANLAQGIYIQSISGFMICIWLIECFLNKKFEVFKCNLYLPIFILLIWSWLSLTWATNISVGIDVALQWTACAVIFFVLFNSIKNTQDSTIIVFSLFASFTYIVVIGMIQYFNPNFTYYPQAFSPGGTFGNKNFLSDYLILVIPFSLYFLLINKGKRSILLNIFSGVFLVSALILICLSKTRAGILAFPIMFCLYFFFLFLLIKRIPSTKDFFSKQKILICASFFALFCVVLITLMMNGKNGNQLKDFGNRIKSIVVLPDKDRAALTKKSSDEKIHSVIDSTTIRLITWANTLKMIQEKPIMGYGLNNWRIHYGEYRDAIYSDPSYKPEMTLHEVHNDYLQLLADLGLIGFFIVLWLNYLIFRNFWRVFFSNDNNIEIKLKSLSIILSIIGLSLICFFSILFVKSIPTLIFFITLALLCSLVSREDEKNNKKILVSLPYKISGYLILPLLFLSGYVTKLELKRGFADKLFKTVEHQFILKDYNAVINVCDEILKNSPLQYRAHLILASAYIQTNNLEKALQEIERGLSYYPNDLLALYQKGSIYVLKIQNELSNQQPDFKMIADLEEIAFATYHHAFKIRSDFEKPWNNLGYVYDKQSYRFRVTGDLNSAKVSLNKAEECFDKALKFNSAYVEAMINKGRILLQTLRTDEGIAQFLKALQTSYEDFEIKDQKFNVVVQQKYLKGSLAFNHSYHERELAKRYYLKIAPQIINDLKGLTISRQQFKDLRYVLDYDIKYNLLKREDEEYQSILALEEFKNGEHDSSQIKVGLNIDMLKERYVMKKESFEKVSLEIDINIAKILLDKAEVLRILGSPNEAIEILMQVNSLAKSTHIPEQNSLAYLRANEIYLDSPEPHLTKLIPIIEENFAKAIELKNPEVIEYKSKLEKKLITIKQAKSNIK